MHPSLAAALRNPVSAIGVALTTASGVLFLFLVGLTLLGFFQNPYIGIVVFVMVPGLFVAGLLLIPLGLWIERRRRGAKAAAPAWPKIDLNDPVIRRALLFVTSATLVNLVIISMASYGAVEYTSSDSFCGEVCHSVMEPELVAHESGPHGRIPCVTCHVGPGAGGFFAAKLQGVSRFASLLRGTYPRPIPAPLATEPDTRTTCQQCHSPARFAGDVIKTFYEHANDEANTETVTRIRLHVGGPVSGTDSGTGIHWHMSRANAIEYVALDEARETIPYVRVTTPAGRVRAYLAPGVTEADLQGKSRRRMTCLDCHNRPAHLFGAAPERAVDAALGAGLISRKIPFIRREAVRALSAAYPSHEVALPQIERTIRKGVGDASSAAFTEADLQRAIGISQAIYRANVFPSMSVGWGTYANQAGHMTSPGCFRCHDDNHATAGGLVIRQDCELCHAIE